MPYPKANDFNYYSQRPYRNVFSQQFNPVMPGLENSFGPQQMSPEDIQNPEQPVVRPRNPYADQLRDLYSKPSPALEEMKAYHDRMPERDQYPPSKLNRVAAALAGISEGWRGGAGRGIEASQAMLESPYRRAYQDWQNRGQGLEARASIEDRNVQRQIAYIKAMSDQEDKDREAGFRERTVANSENRLGMDKERYSRPGTIGVGGQIYNRNPNTGALLNPIGESPGAYSLRMGDIFGDQNRLDQQRFTTGERVAGQGFRAGESEKDRQSQDTRSAANRTAAAARTAASNRSASPQVIATAYELAKKMVQDANPELYAKVYDLDTGAATNNADAATILAVKQKIQDTMNIILQGQNYNPDQTPNHSNKAEIIR